MVIILSVFLKRTKFEPIWGRHASICSSHAAKAFLGEMTKRRSSDSAVSAKVAKASVVLPAPGTEKVAPQCLEVSFATFLSCSSVSWRRKPRLARADWISSARNSAFGSSRNFAWRVFAWLRSSRISLETKKSLSIWSWWWEMISSISAQTQEAPQGTVSLSPPCLCALLDALRQIEQIWFIHLGGSGSQIKSACLLAQDIQTKQPNRPFRLRMSWLSPMTFRSQQSGYPHQRYLLQVSALGWWLQPVVWDLLKQLSSWFALLFCLAWPAHSQEYR